MLPKPSRRAVRSLAVAFVVLVLAQGAALAANHDRISSIVSLSGGSARTSSTGGGGHLAAAEEGGANEGANEDPKELEEGPAQEEPAADATGPVVTPTVDGTLGANDWYTSDVSLTWTVEDPESEVSSTEGCEAQNVVEDTAGVTFTCTATSEGGTSEQSVSIKRDATAPVITVTTPAADAVYLLHQQVEADYGCEDAMSGVDGCFGTVPDGAQLGTSIPGRHAFSISATDQAGNAAADDREYRVQYGSGDTCGGAPGHQILEPIKADGSSTFQQGRTVPAKFRVCDANGESVGAAGVVESFRLVGVETGGERRDVDEAVASTNKKPAFRWDAEDAQWIYNIATKPLAAGSTYFFQIALDDQTTINFSFALRRAS